MSNKRIILTGVLLTLLVPLHAMGAKPLYERLKETVERQIAAEKFDEELVPYLHAVFKEDWELTEDDVRNFLKGNSSDACANIEKAANVFNCDVLKDRIYQLVEYESNVRVLGRSLQSTASSYELPISDLPGRTTKLSADLRAILNIWSAGTGSVKSSINTPIIRSFAADPAIFQPLVTGIGDSLKALNNEEMTAAIWRYQYGVRLVLNERSPRFPSPYADATSGPGTERQYLFKNWPDVEAKLKAVWDEIKDDTFSPPLSANETVYFTFPKSVFDNGLPDNVIVWARIDGNATEGFPFGDVGLQWEVPLEPVLPSLVTEGSDPTAILGGKYPDPPTFEDDEVLEPVDGRGLCTSPVHERGYLCRPFTPVSPDERCPVRPGANPNEIQLVYCTNPADGPPEGIWCCNAARNQCTQKTTSTACITEGGSPSAEPQGCAANGCPVPTINPVFCCMKNTGSNQCVEAVNSSTCIANGGSPAATEQGCVTNGCNLPAPKQQRFTASGPDVCREINWKEAHAFDPNHQCKLSIRCAETCPLAGVIASASLKRADGVIDVCIENDNQNVTATYVLFHELVHAAQFCVAPAGLPSLYDGMPLDQASALCCKIEGEGYRAMCEMAERDGVFEGKSYMGVPINAETCAEIGTDNGCRNMTSDGQKLQGCFLSRTYPEGFYAAYFSALSSNPKGVPAKCPDVLDPATMDPRVKSMIELIEHRDDVCRPGEVNIYKNRIGNNACYIGQCVEMSMEMHRIAAGQTPATISDQTAPWDAPETGTPLGNVLMNPPLAQGRLPAYKPELLMREMETALCQLQGLPPRTPPILCAVDAFRQLSLTRRTGADAAVGLANQLQEQDASLQDLLDMTQGVGARTGTQMYGEYLRESNRSFAGILSMANELLEELDKIDFPTEMCPAGPDLPAPPTSN